MASSNNGTKVIARISQSQRGLSTLTAPTYGTQGIATTSNSQINFQYAFLAQKHRIWDAWIDRWQQNEARMAGGDDVVDELRPFEWETDMSPTGFYALRQAEAVYTNFPDIYATSITGHLLKFAPKPDSGWSVPNLGEVGTASINPSRAEQIWYSVDNPSGAGSEWNQFWADATKRAMATGHRWMYVDSPSEPAGNRAREKEGYRPYLTEYSPCDAYNWFINERDVLEFVIFRLADEGPIVVDGNIYNPNLDRRGYLLLVRAGCQRLGEEFVEGGWWKFDYNHNPLADGHAPWTDTAGEIPVSILYYQRSRGTPMMPAISRPGTTELGQAAVALMNQMSSANYNAWEAGGGVDYLNGIDDDAFQEVERLAHLGSRRIPLPPNSETDVVPTVSPSSLGAVQSTVFETREAAIWSAAVRIGIIEAAGQLSTGSNVGGKSGAAADASFAAAQGPRIVWVAQNLSMCQNNVLRYFELRYGFKTPSGLVNWPNKFDLTPIVDRLRSFFETERLSGMRSKTAGATAMVMAAEEKGLVTDPASKDVIRQEYERQGALNDKMLVNQVKVAGQPKGGGRGLVGAPVNGKSAQKQADRLALQKSDRSKGKPGTNGGRGPKQRPTTPPKPSNRT